EPLQTASRNILQTYSEHIRQAVQKNKPLSVRLFGRLNQDIARQIDPLLPEDGLQFKNTPRALTQLLERLEALADKTVYSKAANILASLNRAQLTAAPDKSFLAQVKLLLQSAGLADEYY